jgi:hypothetical protein
MGISIPVGSGKVINKVGKSGMKWCKVVKKYYFYPQTRKKPYDNLHWRLYG